MGIWQRLLTSFRRRADLFNLEVEPAYAIKASVRNPYFQALERSAREAGFLGSFIVDEAGNLRPGAHPSLQTRHASLTLDIYPNPAAVEGRSIGSYESPDTPRRVPRATLILDDDTELFLSAADGHVRVAGPAIPRDTSAPK